MDPHNGHCRAAWGCRRASRYSARVHRRAARAALNRADARRPHCQAGAGAGSHGARLARVGCCARQGYGRADVRASHTPAADHCWRDNRCDARDGQARDGDRGNRQDAVRTVREGRLHRLPGALRHDRPAPRGASGEDRLWASGARDRRCGRGQQFSVSSRVVRLLQASAHGHFRTTGRYSAATVRGTKWQTIDRCDGTLTVDTKGIVETTMGDADVLAQAGANSDRLLLPPERNAADAPVLHRRGVAACRWALRLRHRPAPGSNVLPALHPGAEWRRALPSVPAQRTECDGVEDLGRRLPTGRRRRQLLRALADQR